MQSAQPEPIRATRACKHRKKAGEFRTCEVGKRRASLWDTNTYPPKWAHSNAPVGTDITRWWTFLDFRPRSQATAASRGKTSLCSTSNAIGHRFSLWFACELAHPQYRALSSAGFIARFVLLHTARLAHGMAAAQVESESKPAEQTVPRRTLSGQVSGVQVCARHCRCTRPRVPLGAELPPRNQSHWPARGVAYRDGGVRTARFAPWFLGTLLVGFRLRAGHTLRRSAGAVCTSRMRARPSAETPVKAAA